MTMTSVPPTAFTTRIHRRRAAVTRCVPPIPAAMTTGWLLPAMFAAGRDCGPDANMAKMLAANAAWRL